MLSIRKPISVSLGILCSVMVASGIAVVQKNGGAGINTARAAEDPSGAAKVDVATVISQEITEWQDYSGRLEAVDKVDVRPLVPGAIVAVHFKDGATVRKGEPLFTIDPRPFQAEVERVAARVAAARARATYAANDAARAERLLTDNAIARRDFDEKQNAAREASANLNAELAELVNAKVRLSYTKIVAPVAGRVSHAELTVGNVVSSDGAAPVLTTVVSVSPIYASFSVDEQTYLHYLNRHAGAAVPVQMGLADEDGFSRTGSIASVDNHLDTQSGTIRVRARFDNADGSLLPGLYARVKVGSGEPHSAMMVNPAAIGTDQAVQYVLVVDNQNRLHYRKVTLGAMHAGMRIITAGLNPGERIVINGLQRVRPNDIVDAHLVDMSASQSTEKPAA
jgi:membrane fusion protein, multidrug efflux system